MFRAAVLFSAVLVLAKGRTTNVSQCIVYPGPLPINTYIDGCTTQPCPLVQGQDAVVNIVFQAAHIMHQMRTLATAFLLILPIQYDLGPNAYTCNFLTNSYCPLMQGEVVGYKLIMPIEEFMPVGTQLPIEFRILDDSNTAIMCIRVQVRIMPPIAKVGTRNATMTVVNNNENMDDIYPI